MNRLLKIFLAASGLLGITTIAVCGFLIFTNINSSPSKPETILATKPITCSKTIDPSDTFWTSERFKF